MSVLGKKSRCTRFGTTRYRFALPSLFIEADSRPASNVAQFSAAVAAAVLLRCFSPCCAASTHSPLPPGQPPVSPLSNCAHSVCSGS